MSLVRVQHTITGHQYTVGAAQAAQDTNLKVLDKPATNLNGEPLAPKFRITTAATATDPKESK